MKHDRPILTVWITKYALTEGVYQATVKHCVDINPRMVTEDKRYSRCYHKPNWHETREEAEAQVKKMLAAKRKSLAKQIAKLDKLEADVGSVFK